MSDFTFLYNQVFTEEGEVKICGREKCKKLIRFCVKEYAKNHTDVIDFGDEKTGFMNIENIKKFYQLSK